MNRITGALAVSALCGTHAASAGAAEAIPEGGRSVLADPLTAYAKRKSNANGSVVTVDAAGPGFTRAFLIESKVRSHDWKYQVFVRLSAPVKKGDALLVHLWARTPWTADESGQSHIRACIEVPGLWKRPQKEKQSLAPLTKSTMVAAGVEWKQFLIRARAPRDMTSDELFVAFRCGMERQRVLVGGMDILNYGHNVAVEDLPWTKPTYAGRELDAPWRTEARARIERHRARMMRISVRDRNGRPLRRAALTLELKRHAFGFGAAFSACGTLERYNPDYLTYRKRITDNFSAASFGNTLKWHPWAGDWGEKHSRAVALEALRWVQQQGLPFRGHCLVWPRKSSVSNAMRRMLEADQPDAAAIQAGILDHIRSIGRATSFWMHEWDVLNESIPCHDVQDICGDRVMVEWFQEARRLLPGVKLALNEYSILSSLTDGDKLQKHEDRIRYLLDNGAPIDVLGMQSHMGGTPPGPERILAVLDRFARFGLPIRTTEFDMKSEDPDILYDFTRDFYTLMFSHPSVIGVQLWGIDQMYEDDGRSSPIGRAHRELVHGTWHTKAEGFTDGRGELCCRGFLGTYAVTVAARGSESMHTAVLPAGDGTHVVTLELKE